LQGSIEIITDQARAKKMDIGYDAWGNRRDPLTWALIKNQGTYFIDRGYTGHEHIDKMSVINMNGRMYDPAIGMFMSPDNFVQNSGLSINYNRYSYCLNNPLKYIDPSGMNYYPNETTNIEVQGTSDPTAYYNYSENIYIPNSPTDGLWDNTPHITAWKVNEYTLNQKTGEYESIFGQRMETNFVTIFRTITYTYEATEELVLDEPNKAGYVGVVYLPDETVTSAISEIVFGSAQGQGDWFDKIPTGTHYGWNWSNETTKARMNHSQTRAFIYSMEDIHKKINSTISRASWGSGVAISLLTKNPTLGIATATFGQAVQEMSGSIADAFNALGRAYNAMDTQSGLFIVTSTDRITTMGTGMYNSSTTSTFYLPTGEVFFQIRY
jgi:RHS repeat-associated protein